MKTRRPRPPGNGLPTQDTAMADGQSSSTGSTARASNLAIQRRTSPPNRTGLPDTLKSNLEQASGLAMDDVRVHYGSARPAQLQALAYTQGNQIHVAPGQEKHLAHEAWHVVQQKQGRVQANSSVAGQPLNDAPGLEAEANRMGQAVAGSGPPSQRKDDSSSPRLGQGLPKHPSESIAIQRASGAKPPIQRRLDEQQARQAKEYLQSKLNEGQYPDEFVKILHWVIVNLSDLDDAKAHIDDQVRFLRQRSQVDASHRAPQPSSNTPTPQQQVPTPLAGAVNANETQGLSGGLFGASSTLSESDTQAILNQGADADRQTQSMLSTFRRAGTATFDTSTAGYGGYTFSFPDGRRASAKRHVENYLNDHSWPPGVQSIDAIKTSLLQAAANLVRQGRLGRKGYDGKERVTANGITWYLIVTPAGPNSYQITHADMFNYYGSQ